MSDRNAQLARQFFQEVWNERRVEAVGKLTHGDEARHYMNGEHVSPDQFRHEIHSRFLEAFPNLKMTIEDVLADETRAVVRWIATGTHRGDALGVKASGQDVQIHGMTWFAFRDDRIVAGWDSWDHGGLLQRLWRAAPPSRDGKAC